MTGDIWDLIHSVFFFVLLKLDADLFARWNIAGAQMMMSAGWEIKLSWRNITISDCQIFLGFLFNSHSKHAVECQWCDFRSKSCKAHHSVTVRVVAEWAKRRALFQAVALLTITKWLSNPSYNRGEWRYAHGLTHTTMCVDPCQPGDSSTSESSVV